MTNLQIPPCHQMESCQCKSPTNHDVDPYVVIYLEELQIIAGLAANMGLIETGGELYGLISHGGRPVVMLATPPGDRSIHQFAHFQQDAEWVKKIDALLVSTFGIQYIGNWHSHHNLCLRELSFRDISSNRSIAIKNGYKHLTQFLLTFDGGTENNSLHTTSRNPMLVPAARHEERHFRISDFTPRFGGYRFPECDISSLNRHPPFIKINSFFYVNAMASDPIRCPLKVLRGSSPIRQAIHAIDELRILKRAVSFPAYRVLVDNYQASKEIAIDSCQLPERLSKQCGALPENALNSLEIVVKDSLLIISLSVPGWTERAFIAYEKEMPNRLVAVYLVGDRPHDKVSDVTEELLRHGRRARLLTVYNQLIRLGGQEAFVRRKYRFEETPRESHCIDMGYRDQKLNTRD